MQILTNGPLLARGPGMPGRITRRFFELPRPDQRPYQRCLGGRCRSRLEGSEPARGPSSCSTTRPARTSVHPCRRSGVGCRRRRRSYRRRGAARAQSVTGGTPPSLRVRPRCRRDGPLTGGDGPGRLPGIANQIELGLSDRCLKARTPPGGPTLPVHLVCECSKVDKRRQHAAQQQQAQFRDLEDPSVVQRRLKCGPDLRQLLRRSGRQSTKRR